MTDRPWYKRYPSDALNGMVGLTLEQKGAYNVVLDLIYDRDGPIPDEERWLAGHCGCSVRKWKSIRDTLLALGKIELIDGLIDQKRARKERENARKTREKLAENGSKGGRKRAENADEALKTNDNFEAGLKHRARDQKLEARSQKPEKNISHPTDAQVAAATGDGADQKSTRSPYTAEFERFWEAYPTRTPNPKKPAFNAWIAAKRHGADPETMIRGAANYARWVRRRANEDVGWADHLIAQAQTFIRQARWEEFADIRAGPDVGRPRTMDEIRKARQAC